MKKKNMLKKNGITLVALVITIIILLLLAGITIATLGGENGLFAKVKQSKEKYSISEAKEKLELAISTLQIEQEGKGENLKKEDLTKINDDEIDVRDTSNFPIKVICNNYEFNIDSNFVVSYVGIANETIITYTTEPEGYTNKNEIKILVKIKNSKGIKTIEYPNDNDKLLANGQTEIGLDYKVTANGTYTFKIVDNDNKETKKDIVIDKIDTVEPKEFTPSIENTTMEGFTIVANAEDGDATRESSKSGIEKYEFYINNVKYESDTNKYMATGLNKNTNYNVYVIAYDKAGNSKKSEVITAKTSSTLPPPVANITFNENNATKKAADYPLLTMSGMKNCILEPNKGEEVTLEITSKKSDNIIYYYSEDGGNTWNEYTQPVKISYNGDNLIKVKSMYINNNIESEAQEVKKYISYEIDTECTASNSLKKIAYDKNINSYMSILSYDDIYFRVSTECWGKYINIDCSTPTHGFYGWISLGNKNGFWDNPLAGYLVTFTGISAQTHCIRSLKIPENSFWGVCEAGTSGQEFRTYEVWCGEENLTGQINNKK